MDPLFGAGRPFGASLPLDVLAGLTFLALVPFLAVTTTSFVRIVVVLSLVRSAIGASSLPPNAVLTALAMLLSLVVMAPTFDAVSRNAVAPYAAGKLSQREMLARAFAPVEAFMLRQAHRKDVALFGRLAKLPAAGSHPPPTVLIPAFIVGELRSAAGGLASVQAAAVRHGRRLGAGLRRGRRDLPLRCACGARRPPARMRRRCASASR